MNPIQQVEKATQTAEAVSVRLQSTLVEIIESVKNGVGPVASLLYEEFVRLKYVMAGKELVIAIILFIASLFVAKQIKKADQLEEEIEFIAFLALWVVRILLLISCLVWLAGSFDHIAQANSPTISLVKMIVK